MTLTRTSPGPDDGSPLRSRAGDVLDAHLAQPLAPGLYVVATPIGNLADISLRALSVLARADLIFCEDTRHTRKLLSHFAIRGELHAYHEHNAARERPRVLARIRAGFSVALVSDAGTPLVSDPGYKLVRAARAAGLDVTAVPGPSAPMAALASAGLASDHFFFEGFLPAKPGARRKRLEALRDVPATLIFFEAPNRLAATLAALAETLGPREAAIAKELTKLHERLEHGTLDALADQFAAETGIKGEFVILVAAPEPQEVSDDAIRARLADALDGASVRDAARAVADALGVHKSRVYKLALALKEQGTEG